MVRTVISLDPEEKAWLDRKARETRRPMTAIVREAVARYRAEESRRRKPALPALLDQTSGMWKHGDGLAWQVGLRREWDAS
ncbi:MAG: ribbon-helix-helix protein, CopG family [Alphaproteobacteria bacterium]|nr:ribbon-helix-helix protein, CopG family [Alphaproteobacteria bacterium]